MELADELSGGVGQIAAVAQQLPPEPFGGGPQRHRTESVAHLPQQHGQMSPKPSPITVNDIAPALDFGTSVLAVKPSGDGRGVNRNFMDAGGMEPEAVDLQADDRKGLHYIFEIVSFPIEAVAGTWDERIRGGGCGGNSQPSFPNNTRCSGSGCV